MKLLGMTLGGALLAVALCGTCLGAESGWQSGFNLPGLNGTPTALGHWGDGLVVSGTFSQAGPISAYQVALWQEGAWQALGDGLPQPASALAEYQGWLYAGTNSGMWIDGRCYNLARWGGTAWEPVGVGALIEGTASVATLLEFRGELVVGGRFDKLGYATTLNIARWDGTTWTGLGSGMQSPANPLAITHVLALAEYNGELIAGGTFDQAGGAVALNIARWDGTLWRPVGTATLGEVRQIVPYSGVLFVRHGTTLSRWDGSSWHSGPVPAGPLGPLVAAGGDLFLFAGNALFRWNGSTWQSLGDQAADGTIWVAADLDSEVVAGGSFTQIGGAPTRCLAVLREGAWESLDETGGGLTAGTSTGVWGLTSYGGNVVAGGSFTEAGGVSASRIAAWDGTHWQPFGAGFNGAVLALAEYRGELIAGGMFTFSGGVQALGIAAWNGSTWRPLGSGVYSPSGPGYIASLLVFDDTLYVGGGFARAGSANAANIARWDGTTWSPVGTGADDDVLALATYNGEVVAGGAFRQIGSAVGPVARWTGGEWISLRENISLDEVADFAVVEDRLVAGGTTPNGPTTAAACAAWNGTGWEMFPILPPMYGTVNALAVLGDKLIAGGYFQRDIARWTGSAWEYLGTGCDERVNALLVTDSGLFVGGMFTQAGDKPSSKIARWTDSQVPVDLVSFTAAWKEGVATIQWQIAGERSEYVGFVLWREAPDSPREPVTGVLTSGGPMIETKDPGAPAEGCRYFLAELERSGRITWHGPVDIAPRPKAFLLYQNHPNPFRTETRIAFEIPEAGDGELAVFDTAGRKVMILRSGVLPAGLTAVTWDRRDARGEPVAAGVYFLCLETGTRVAIKKMVVLGE